MKFKIDENLPIEVAQLLRKAGHDVFTVYDQKLAGTKDAVLARVCQDEQRALITLDSDFADIRTYPPADFHGLIVLRLIRQDKVHVLDVISKTLKLFETEALNRKLWIVDENRIRMRS
jgi:predicted nuclease of predicted toxin-antitoxin system